MRPNVDLEFRNEEVDGVLRAFFQTEMPAPWPALAPADHRGAIPPHTSLRPLFWSRAALAASVALLLIGQLWVAGSYKPQPSAGVVPQGVDVATPPRPRHPRADAARQTADPRATDAAAPVPPALKNMR